MASDTAIIQPQRVAARATTAVLHADSLPVLQMSLQAWLQQSFAEAGQAVQIEALGAWGMQPAWLPDVRASIVEQVRTNSAWQVTVSLAPSTNPDGAADMAATYRFKALELKPVWVAAVPLSKGDDVSCSHVRLESRVVKGTAASWQGGCEALQGQRMRHALSPGDAVMVRDVAFVGAVTEHQEAIVTSRLGNVEVQALGMALADAQVGQRVPVRLNGQKTVIQAVVTAPGQVQVIEGL